MDKTCPHCSTVFAPKHNAQKFCSRPCRRKHSDEDKRYREKNKDAIAARIKEWNKANPENGRAACRRWQAKNKDKREAYDAGRVEIRKTQHRMRRYGLSEAEHQQMLSDQDGKCAMCFKELPPRTHTDHCHKTGKVRGILCAGCNHSLGYFEKPGYIELALAYLAKTAALPT